MFVNIAKRAKFSACSSRRRTKRVPDTSYASATTLANWPNWPDELPEGPTYTLTCTRGTGSPSAPMIWPPEISVTYPLSGSTSVVSFTSCALPMASAASAA